MSFIKRIGHRRSVPRGDIAATGKKKNSTKQLSLKKWYFLVLLLPVIIFTLWSLYKVANYYLSSFPVAPGNFTASAWNNTNQFNILLVRLEDIKKKSATIEGLSVVQVIPDSESIRFLELPLDVQVSAARGLDEYQLKKIYSLGAILDRKENMVLLKDTIEKNLAIPIDGYIAYDTKTVQALADSYKLQVDNLASDPKKLISSNQNNLRGLNFYLLLFSLKEQQNIQFLSNLTGSEFMLLGKHLRILEQEKIYAGQISDDMLAITEKDGVNTKKINELKVDFYLKSNFYDYYVRQEAKKVKVFNAAGVPQIASKASRQLSNLGLEVVDVGNEATSEITYLDIQQKDRNSETVKAISQLFNAKVKIGKFDAADREDVRLVVGKDWVSKMEGDKSL